MNFFRRHHHRSFRWKWFCVKEEIDSNAAFSILSAILVWIDETKLENCQESRAHIIKEKDENKIMEIALRWVSCRVVPRISHLDFEIKWIDKSKCDSQPQMVYGVKARDIEWKTTVHMSNWFKYWYRCSDVRATCRWEKHGWIPRVTFPTDRIYLKRFDGSLTCRCSNRWISERSAQQKNRKQGIETNCLPSAGRHVERPITTPLNVIQLKRCSAIATHWSIAILIVYFVYFHLIHPRSMELEEEQGKIGRQISARWN